MRTPGAGTLCRGFKGVLAGALGKLGLRCLGRFPHCVHKGGQVIAARRPGLAGKIQPDDFPSQRNGQAGRVCIAQIVTMGFGVGCQRPQDRGGVGVDVGQGGDSRLSAR